MKSYKNTTIQVLSVISIKNFYSLVNLYFLSKNLSKFLQHMHVSKNYYNFYKINFLKIKNFITSR